MTSMLALCERITKTADESARLCEAIRANLEASVERSNAFVRELADLDELVQRSIAQLTKEAV